MESGNVGPDLFSWKTSKESSQPKQKEEKVFCSMSSETWSQWVTFQRQEYSQRVKLAHHIKGKESSLWGTPQTTDAHKTLHCEINSKQHGLARSVARDMGKRWATPTVHGNTNAKGISKNSGDGLRTQVMKWPTPRTSDAEGGRIEVQMTEKGFRSQRKTSGKWFGAKLRDAVESGKTGPHLPAKSNTNGKSHGQHLNPNWVEGLMGLEVGWTQLPTDWID